MPPLRKTLDLLVEATQTGEILSIEYHGGSKPGSRRQIAPIRIDGGSVVARCYSSGQVKHFNIRKIQVFENDAPISYWNPRDSSPPQPRYNNLPEVVQCNEAELLSIGWHIVFDEESISLFRRFKNGKLLKHPEIRIEYVETIEDGYYDLDMNWQSEIKQRTRPWVISMRNGGTAFGRIDRAAQRFMQEARRLAPLGERDHGE